MEKVECNCNGIAIIDFLIKKVHVYDCHFDMLWAPQNVVKSCLRPWCQWPSGQNNQAGMFTTKIYSWISRISLSLH